MVLKKANSFLDNVTPVILTYNEAPNISRVLEKLNWAHEVVVVDSGSNDDTLNIISSYPNVRCVYRKFDEHARQWNFAISETNIQSEWVLALDADYILSNRVIDEIGALHPSDDIAGYETRFRYCVWGKPLRGTLYPPVITLFRKLHAYYEQDGHTQRVNLDAKLQYLQNVIYHDDRKPLSRWLWAQERYSELEAETILCTSWDKLRFQDRLRRMIVITPWLVPIYCLTVGRGLLDGWAGICYALQRGIAEAVLSLKLIEAKFNKRIDD